MAVVADRSRRSLTENDQAVASLDVAEAAAASKREELAGSLRNKEAAGDELAVHDVDPISGDPLDSEELSAGESGQAPDAQAGGSDGGDPPPASGDSNRPRWLLPVGIALSVLLIGLLVLSVFFGIKTVNGFRLEQGRDNVLATAKQAAANLTTFNFETAEADVQRLKDSTTPTFESGFANDKNTFVKFLRDGKVKMTGDITEGGVLSYDGNTAHVLVAVKAQVGNAAQPQAQARNYRMDITMVYQDGRWLANAAEFVQ